jgi:hypothetical protein
MRMFSLQLADAKLVDHIKLLLEKRSKESSRIFFYHMHALGDQHAYL